MTYSVVGFDFPLHWLGRHTYRVPCTVIHLVNFIHSYAYALAMNAIKQIVDILYNIYKKETL